MKNYRLYWEFHKSTLIINWGFSIVASLIMAKLIAIPYISMTGGPLLSFLYNELAKKNEYYYYNNRGISKLSLLIVSFSLDIITGIIILTIIYNA